MPPFEIIRPPDGVTTMGERETFFLAAASETRFVGRGIELDTLPGDGVLALRLRATIPLMYLQLRWNERIPEGLRYLGDTWERAEAPMEWRCLAPERDLPWYFLAYDGQHTHSVGVKTGASALCRWRIDPFGVTLWLDVRNGAGSVHLGDRELALADVVARPGKVWELPFQAARRFAALLDNERLLPEQPLYGFCATQHAHAAAPTIRDEARLLADLAENTVNRPYYVVDEGWQQGAGTVGMQPGPKLGDPVALAQDILEVGCRPGLWLRPLLSGKAEHDVCALPPGRFGLQLMGRVLDPTNPETEETIRLDVARAVAWGFELLHYDGTTRDLLGDYDPFPPRSTEPGWRFRDHGLTNAEVLRNLYALIREATRGRALLAASNTMSHLAAGQVHMQSIAERAGIERMLRPHIVAANALAFRGYQHGALYAALAGPVTLHPHLPWQLGEQWLRLVAASGTPCFVAPGAEPLDTAQQRALRTAFSQASRQLPLAEPLDWLATTGPGRWKLGNETVTFDWYSAQYAPST